MEKLKKFLRSGRQAVLTTLTLMLICGLGFPLLLNGLAAVIFPNQANGSLVTVDGTAIGSKFVGQEFTEPYFMKCRPSAVHYNTYKTEEDGTQVYSDGSSFNGVASGSSNYGPSNPALQERVKASMDAFLAANPDIRKEDIPADLMTASGSGLDPHITPEAANIQIPGIAAASGLSESALKTIVENNTEGKLLGIFGEDKVNVLLVNLEIAKAMELI